MQSQKNWVFCKKLFTTQNIAQPYFVFIIAGFSCTVIRLQFITLRSCRDCRMYPATSIYGCIEGRVTNGWKSKVIKSLFKLCKKIKWLEPCLFKFIKIFDLIWKYSLLFRRVPLPYINLLYLLIVCFIMQESVYWKWHKHLYF